MITARSLFPRADQLIGGLVRYPVVPCSSGAIFFARTQRTRRSNALSACSTDLLTFWSVTLIYAERNGTLPRFSMTKRVKSSPSQVSNFLKVTLKYGAAIGEGRGVNFGSAEVSPLMVMFCASR